MVEWYAFWTCNAELMLPVALNAALVELAERFTPLCSWVIPDSCQPLIVPRRNLLLP